jgi:hypothetical protein
MQATTFTSVLNEYERSHNAAYCQWYENNLPDFLEPDYEPDLLLRKNTYVDWNLTTANRRLGRDVFYAKDGSVAQLTETGRWAAFSKNFAPKT